ncbi:hypothetical protein PT974_07915 [Cladobotryum mycophilum]|uniref:Uncharacterized protein n=1 Tax=Cladobotryum mycophilum TaxID=491253 RepID=A0ABR0SD06_9HYPO
MHEVPSPPLLPACVIGAETKQVDTVGSPGHSSSIAIDGPAELLKRSLTESPSYTATVLLFVTDAVIGSPDKDIGAARGSRRLLREDLGCMISSGVSFITGVFADTEGDMLGPWKGTTYKSRDAARFVETDGLDNEGFMSCVVNPYMFLVVIVNRQRKISQDDGESRREVRVTQNTPDDGMIKVVGLVGSNEDFRVLDCRDFRASGDKANRAEQIPLTLTLLESFDGCSSLSDFGFRSGSHVERHVAGTLERVAHMDCIVFVANRELFQQPLS